MLRRLALIATLTASPAAADMVARVSTLTWSEPYSDFGSFSGLAVSPDGRSFVTVSDKGFYARGTLTRTQSRLAEVSLADHGPLLRIDSTPVSR
ncbi:MAG: hypothetical protein AAFY59_17835, partial [Pseudomonadota bacterium]